MRKFGKGWHGRRAVLFVSLEKRLRIAITGGVAEGKSTVLRYVQEHGLTVASADDLARDAFNERYTQESIANLLGVEPPVSTKLVRDSILREPRLRRALNRLTHPQIVRSLEQSVATAIEVPLLIETCLQGHFDRIWVVTCGNLEQR